MKILAIETSCDETSVAIVENSRIFSNVISSQYFHNKFGGVVPELASRAHLQNIYSIMNTALEKANIKIEDVDAVAVTSEPGLAGSLIVGSNFAKGLGIKYNIPVVPVNHIEGHIFSGCIEDNDFEFPFISLVVSGGHTALFLVKSYSKYEIIGLTKDDAAGEAFDKIAKIIGLPYPGGPEIDKLAKNGNNSAYNFPRSMINSGDFNFSFSGLKTSVKYFIQKNYPNEIPENIKPDIAASVQAAIVDVLVKKTIDAAIKLRIKRVVVSGGVSANSYLRSKLYENSFKHNIETILPEFQYCMDNAAMIGFIAEKKLKSDYPSSFFNLSFKVSSTALRAKKK